MLTGISESQFYMWRTLFAIAHIDNVVTQEEVDFMTSAIDEIPFSPAQKDVLVEDIGKPQGVVDMFDKITDKNDQSEFFKFARELVWVDGDYGPEEQQIMLALKEIHIKETNVDDLIGTVSLELEGEPANMNRAPTNVPPEDGFKGIIGAFRERFF